MDFCFLLLIEILSFGAKLSFPCELLFLACVMAAINICHHLHLKLKPTGSDLSSDHTFVYIIGSKGGVSTISLNSNPLNLSLGELSLWPVSTACFSVGV